MRSCSLPTVITCSFGDGVAGGLFSGAEKLEFGDVGGLALDDDERGLALVVGVNDDVGLALVGAHRDRHGAADALDRVFVE